MKRTIRELALVVLVASATVVSIPSAVAIAQSTAGEGGPPPPPPGGERGPGRRPPPFEDVLERNADRLGLDPRTRAEIRAIADASREESRSLDDSLRQLHEEMRKILDQDAPKLDAALSQAERIGAAETELNKIRLRSMLRIRALLTPEQRQELVRIHQERRREQDRGGPPGPPPHGPPLDAP